MPAGYDPRLDTELPTDPDFNSQFDAPPVIGGDIADSGLDAQLFGGGSSSGSGGNKPMWPDGSTSIFEAAQQVERKKVLEEQKRGGGIPAYARDLLKQHKLREAEDEDELEDDTDEGDDVDFDFDADLESTDVGGGGDDLDFDDTDDDEAFNEEGFDDDEELEGSDIADRDQTQRWRDEKDVEEEMARLLGGDSPYAQGQSRDRTLNKDTSPTYQNASTTKSGVDADLESAETFPTGAFMEHYDDGFVFVSGEGHTLAFADPDEDDVGVNEEDPTKIRAVFVIRSVEAQDDEDEVVIELSGEEIESLASALQKFRTSTQSFGGLIERAKRHPKRRRR